MLSPVYTVKRAAALTGISADTLRMWERRYGVVAPVRTEGGYRLYDDAAIARLTAMHALVNAGWAPREAAAQVASGTTLGPIASRPAESDGEASGGEDADDADGVAVDPELLVRLALAFDTESLRHALDQVFADHDLSELVDSWLMPALHRLGDAWQRGEVSSRPSTSSAPASNVAWRPHSTPSPHRRRSAHPAGPGPGLSPRARPPGVRRAPASRGPRCDVPRVRRPARQLGRGGDDT